MFRYCKRAEGSTPPALFIVSSSSGQALQWHGVTAAALFHEWLVFQPGILPLKQLKHIVFVQ
jgi:hypothetical protein